MKAANNNNTDNIILPHPPVDPPSQSVEVKKKKEQPKLKAVHYISIIGITVLLIVICVAVFGLTFSQSSLDPNGKQVFEQHKQKSADSVAKATGSVQKLPNLVTDDAFTDFSTKLFERVSTQLDIVDIKKKEESLKTEADARYITLVLEDIDKCNHPASLITNTTKYLEMLNKEIEWHNSGLKNITKPIDDAKSKFDNFTTNELGKVGRLSKSNIVVYASNMTQVLSDHQSLIEEKDNSYIESYQHQIDSQEASKLSHLVYIITSFSIEIGLLAIEIGVFFCFLKGKITLETFKRISYVIIAISGIFALGYFIFSILGSIGISPFSYDCKLEAKSENSAHNFYNYNGEAVNQKTITSDCEKGQTIYLKLSLLFDKNKLNEHLDGYANYVTNFATVFQTLQFADNSEEIKNHKRNVEDHRDGYEKYKTCLNDQPKIKLVTDQLQKLIDILEDLRTRTLNIEPLLKNLPSKIDEFIRNALPALKQAYQNVITSMNNELKSSDFECYLSMPPGICQDFESNMFKISIGNWLIFASFLLVSSFANLLCYFGRKITGGWSVTHGRPTEDQCENFTHGGYVVGPLWMRSSDNFTKTRLMKLMYV